MKLCSKCKLPGSFTSDRRHKDGLQSQCQECRNRRWRNLYKNDVVFRTNHKKRVLKEQIENPAARNARRNAWDKRHPAKANAKWAKRHAQKLLATPKWLTQSQLKEIELIYIQAHTASRELGIKYSVDHIVPLRGQEVSGLHVPWNLRVITASENYRKANKWSIHTQ